jgi:hypothetical protein
MKPGWGQGAGTQEELEPSRAGPGRLLVKPEKNPGSRAISLLEPPHTYLASVTCPPGVPGAC